MALCYNGCTFLTFLLKEELSELFQCTKLRKIYHMELVCFNINSIAKTLLLFIFCPYSPYLEYCGVKHKQTTRDLASTFHRHTSEHVH